MSMEALEFSYRRKIKAIKFKYLSANGSIISHLSL